MTGPWFFVPLGVALAAYAITQLGPTPAWWNVATAVIMLAAATVFVWRGIHDVVAARRSPRD